MTTASINGRAIDVRPGETLLQAALRGGVEFPYSCRVGGCGTCRCKLLDGDVKELTETGYLLTEEELAQRTILACQSVPKGDVRIEVEAPASVEAVVVAQQKVTHDITKLTVKLSAPLTWKPGQYANLTFAGAPTEPRSYSFGTPAPDALGHAEFFIRLVPGGRVSALVNNHELTGETVRVSGPYGEFQVQEGTSPLLFVAGGSGLSPILAMLEALHERGDARSVTLLFGARQQRDLYALDVIERLQRAWPSTFHFVPVLSDEPHDTSWNGARGLVTEQLPALIEPGAHAYLCGPPQMIDTAIAQLKERGVHGDDIRFDRFTTAADVVTAAVQPEATVFDYVKFGLFHAIALFGIAAVLLGHWYTTGYFLGVVAFVVGGDLLLGSDERTPRYKYPGILTLQLWLALPLILALAFAAVWSVSATDPFGFGAWLTQHLGYDFLAARAATGAGHHVVGVVLIGLLFGIVGTITAHELTHRTWDPVSMFIGRWLLAFSFDTIFAIEHVYGHHRYVSTTEDPATAPRGRNVYTHIIVSTFRGNVSAWKIEAGRLRRKKLPVFSPYNAFLRGHLMSVALLAAAYALGELRGLLFFLACVLWAKALLEIVNYMEHYGMVRDPSTPVQPRHSWNSNHRISSWATFNLTRHSHHHAQGEVPYHELRPMPDAPMMVSGYLSTLILTMVPPLWHRLMTPKVLEWDRRQATSHERQLAAQANARSGLPAFQQ